MLAECGAFEGERALTVGNDGHVTDVGRLVHQGPDLPP